MLSKGIPLIQIEQIKVHERKITADECSSNLLACTIHLFPISRKIDGYSVVHK